MNFVTTKEFSEKWDISPRRITQFAKQGRIPGAFLRDRRWLIPEDAKKPEDPRIKPKSNKDKYIFPYIIPIIHSKEQIESFSKDEKTLYYTNCLFEEGKLDECINELKDLLIHTDNIYIRLGIYYLISLTYIYLGDIEKALEYGVIFKAAYFETTEHKTDMDFLYYSFETEISNYMSITNNINTDTFINCSSDLISYLSVVNAYVDLCNNSTKNYPVNILSHEIICNKLEREGNYYCSMLLHSYISLMYSVIHDETNEIKHLKRAIDIAICNHTYFSLAQTMSFNPDTVNKILKDYPDEVSEKIHYCISRYVNAHIIMSKYNSGSTLLSKLQKEDFILISYCLKDFKVEKMAELLLLSQSGVKKRLNSLYKKLDVNNKKEMLNKFVDLMLNTKLD